MNKIVLSITASALLINMAQAEEKLEDIMVTTATKTQKSINGVTASVEVVTSEEIEKTGATTLRDVFKKLPSLSAQFGKFPHPSSKSKGAISIRGAGANGTLLLIDGKRLSGETENPYEMDRIPTAMIEKIEIVKGSMSTLYGSDAIGGVINIITKKSNKPMTSLDVKYGQNGEGEAKEKSINFSTLGKNGKVSYKVYGSLVKGSPFTVDTPYKQQAVNPQNHQPVNDSVNDIRGKQAVTYIDDSTIKTVGFGLGYEINENTEIGFDVNYFEEEREGQYIGLHPKPRPDLETKKVLVKGTPVNSVDENSRKDISLYVDHMISDDVSLKVRTYMSDYEKRNFTTAINNLDGTHPVSGATLPSPTNVKFSADVKIEGVELTSTIIANDENLITTGIEYRKETRDSSAINPDPNSNAFITKETEYESFFIQDEIDFSDTLHATIGGRFDSISGFDSKPTFQAGIIKNLSEKTNVRFNFAQGYRTPDVAELFVVAPFFKDARRFGADVIFGPKQSTYDLKPETSQTMEVAVSHRSNAFQGELVLFNSQIEDKIELVAKNNGQPNKYYTSENVDEVEVNGAELSLAYTVNKDLDFGFNATMLKTENKKNGKELTFTPKLSASLSTNYALTEDLSSSFILRHIGEQYSDTQNTQTLKAYNIADVAVNYGLNKSMELYAGVNNIGDEEIDTLLGGTVGRYYFTGIRANF